MFCLSQLPHQSCNSEGTKSKTSRETNACLFLEKEVLQQRQTQIIVRLEECAAAGGWWSHGREHTLATKVTSLIFVNCIIFFPLWFQHRYCKCMFYLGWTEAGSISLVVSVIMYMRPSQDLLSSFTCTCCFLYQYFYSKLLRFWCLVSLLDYRVLQSSQNSKVNQILIKIWAMHALCFWHM